MGAPRPVREAHVNTSRTVSDLDGGLVIEIPASFNGNLESQHPPEQWTLATVRHHIVHGLRVAFKVLREDQGFDFTSFEPTPGTADHPDLSQIHRPTLGDMLEKKVGHEAFRAVIRAYRDQCIAHLEGRVTLKKQERPYKLK